MRTYLLVCLPAMASTCVLLAAFDRCASTSSLDRWRRLSSIQFAQRALILTMLFLLLLGSFHLFIFDIRNGTCASLPGFQAIISSLYGNIFVALLPHSGMIMFGIMTWKHLQQSKRRVATVSIPDDRILAVQRTNRQLLLMIFPYAFLASVIEAQRTATYTYSMLTSSAKKSVERQQIEYLILQTALKGNVITFMHNMPNIVTSLPLDVDDLSDTLKIIFIGAHTPDRVQLLNEANITKLPEDDVPESIWTTLERIENTHDGNAERTGFTDDPLSRAVDHNEKNTENICGINPSAVLDANGTMVSSEDIGVHLLRKVHKGLTNVSSDMLSKSNEDEDDVYMIPRSNMPINDCFNPELFLGLYPTLFPYGYGAPQDSSRPVAVTLEQHIRYLLAYDDQRFEKHHSFMFVIFNIMQRRQACWNATLMASRPYFQNAANDLQTLTSGEIEAALMAISKNTFSAVENPRINMIMRQIKTVGGNVMGSAYSRAALRTQIHALIFNQGLPSIFMTINPADIHSRVTLYFAGVDLDLDEIIPM
ncbi:unnamed protein product, partial [Adineta ricciae]